MLQYLTQSVSYGAHSSLSSSWWTVLKHSTTTAAKGMSDLFISHKWPTLILSMQWSPISSLWVYPLQQRTGLWEILSIQSSWWAVSLCAVWSCSHCLRCGQYHCCKWAPRECGGLACTSIQCREMSKSCMKQLVQWALWALLMMWPKTSGSIRVAFITGTVLHDVYLTISVIHAVPSVVSCPTKWTMPVSECCWFARPSNHYITPQCSSGCWL